MSQTDMDRGPSGRAEPPREGNLALGLAGGVAGAIAAVLVYYGLWRLLDSMIVPGLLVGVVVGLPVRLLGRGRDSRFAWLAVGCAFVAYSVAFVWTDLHRDWTPPITLARAIRHLFQLTDVILVHLVTLSIAYTLGARRSG